MAASSVSKGQSGYSMLVKVYGRWMDSKPPRELERIWSGIQSMAQIAQNLPKKLAA